MPVYSKYGTIRELVLLERPPYGIWRHRRWRRCAMIDKMPLPTKSNRAGGHSVNPAYLMF